MTLEEAEAWLRGRIDYERAPGYAEARLDLAPIRALLEGLGRPDRGLRVLHVAGSKGKGSVALLAEALLGEAGLRTGVYTSPHLKSWTERFRLGGAEVEGTRLARAVARVRPAVEALAGSPEDPTWFDVTTAVGLLLFAEAEVDLAVLEVGLGGRLDSTNVVEPAICAITSIELEHTERLGTTLAAIAGEKAGILKPGVPALIGRLPEEAQAAVEARAEEVGAPLAVLGRDFDATGQDGRLALRDGALSLDVALGVRGTHQVDNAALAVGCVRRLLDDDDLVHGAALRALPGVVLPARIEVVGREPLRVVDAAHTAASAQRLAEALEAMPSERATLVLSVSVGKDLEAIAGSLAPRFDRAVVTRAEPVRSADPVAVAAALRSARPGLPVEVEPDPARALERARAAAAPRDLVCATGSIYLAGLAREMLRG